MTMFAELYALATHATLTMVVSADEKNGKLTISVLPKPKKDLGEPALTKDLTLTATPEEFDTGFVAALRGYREQRASLTEQAEATKEVLEAAKALSVKAATDAVAKAKTKTSKPTQAACATVAKEGGGDDDTAVESPDENEPPATLSGESLQLFG